MKKANLAREKEVLGLLIVGYTPKEIAQTLEVSRSIIGHTVSWLLLHGYLRKEGWGKYQPTNKPFRRSSRGKVELIGQVGDLYIISRPNPIDSQQIDYFGVVLREDHLEIKTLDLGSLLQDMQRYPAAILLTACTLDNLKAAVGGGVG